MLKKIEQLKSKYEHSKKDNEANEKEHALRHLQIEMLVQRINDLTIKKNRFKKELIDTKYENMKLAQMKVDLDEINEELNLHMDRAGLNVAVRKADLLSKEELAKKLQH